MRARAGLIGSIALLAALALPPARAWPQAAGMAGVGSTFQVTTRAKVDAVDPATRAVTLIGADGRRFTVIAGPRVINFARIKAGDRVLAHYQESVAYVLSPPSAKAPPSSITTTETAAPAGAAPAGSVGAKLVVTGLVIAVDPARHVIRVVDPTGGAVTTAHVSGADAIRNLGQIKVGDTITAVVSQALALAIEPAA